jgi:hypothetical protein
MILFEMQASGDGPAGSAIRGAFGIAPLEVHLTGGHLLPGVETIAAAHCTQTMIHGLRPWLPILLELVAGLRDQDIVSKFAVKYEPMYVQYISLHN